MNEEKPPLADALRHLAEQKRRSLTEHPTPQELASYHAGELPPEAEARLREHLSLCRECSDLLLDLAGFAELKPPEGVPELTDDEVEQDWQALRSRMGKGQPAPVVPIRPAGVPRRERRYLPLLPVAASLLAVLGFSFGLYQSWRVTSLSKQLEGSQQPSVVEVLGPENTERGPGGEDEANRMTSQGGGVFIVSPPEDHPSYRVEIRQDEKILWGTTIPAGDKPVDSIAIRIPGNFLEPGIYKVQLYGGKNREETRLTNDDLKVE